VVVVELHATPDTVAAEVVARELELAAGAAVSGLPWVRVQVVPTFEGGPNL
jgi:hypothetical protein